jgi:hypothetical protein
MVSEINAGSIPHDSVLVIRQILASGTTDPITATRSADSKFILTSYPTRPAEYPIITIKCNTGPSELLGSNSEAMQIPLDFEVRVWARNEKEKDELMGAVINQLRTSQKGINPISGTESFGLFDFHMDGSANVDEPGVEGVLSKVLPVGYNFIVV